MQTGLSGLFSRVSFQHRLSTCVSTAIVCNHMHQQLRGGYKFQALAAKQSSDTGKNSTKPVNAQRQNVVQQGNFIYAIPPPPPHTSPSAKLVPLSGTAKNSLQSINPQTQNVAHGRGISLQLFHPHPTPSAEGVPLSDKGKNSMQLVNPQ